MAEPAGSPLELLTGPDARDLLAAAVGTAGGELQSYRSTTVDHRPGTAGTGGSTTVSYRARVRWADGERGETLAATTAPLPSDPPAGVLALSDGARTVAVWRFRDDPGLPALAAATDPAAMAALLESFGVRTPGGRRIAAASVQIHVRAYRPRRRAVVEVTAPGARLFVKVVRPVAVQALHERHVLLHGAGVPAPRSLGWTDDGLLVLSALTGTDVRALMRAGAPLPPAADLIRVLDALPPQVRSLPRRASWTDNVAHYAAVVAATAPHEATRAGELAAAVRDGVDGTDGADAAHGDFYETQLLVGGGVEPRITGVLDVDTAGPGRRADDLACLLAHASLLATIEPAHRVTTDAAVTGWLREVEVRGDVDRADLRHRIAGVLVSLATGPYRVQQTGWADATTQRLDLVERWLGAARR